MTVVLSCSLFGVKQRTLPNLPLFALIESAHLQLGSGNVSPLHANLAEREPRRGGAESGEAKHVPCGFYSSSVKDCATPLASSSRETTDIGPIKVDRPDYYVSFRTLVPFSSRVFNHGSLSLEPRSVEARSSFPVFTRETRVDESPSRITSCSPRSNWVTDTRIERVNAMSSGA